MTKNKDDLHPPVETEKDGWHTIIKAGVSGVPGVGGALAELFNFVVAPQIDKRRYEWMKAVSQRLKELEKAKTDFNIDVLSENEQFATAVVRATRAALATHGEEKLDALQNAVLNVAVGRAPNDDLQQMFLNFVDEVTSWHILILRLFQDPRSYGEIHGITWPEWKGQKLDSIIECAFPQLRGLERFYEEVLRDLNNRGLLEIDLPRSAYSDAHLLRKRTTGMGDEFYSFITALPNYTR